MHTGLSSTIDSEFKYGKPRPIAFISGPISKGDMDENLRLANEAASKLADLGFAPIGGAIFLGFYNFEKTNNIMRPWTSWMEIVFPFLCRASIVLRIPGESVGADKEVAWAMEYGVPVVHSLEEAATLAAKFLKHV